MSQSDKKHSRKKLFIITGVLAAGLAVAVVSHAKSGGWHHGHGWSHSSGYGSSHNGMENHMKAVLKKFDADEDSMVSFQEIEAGIKGYFKTANKNGDDRLTLDEYENLWIEATREKMIRSFQYFDSEGKGYLTQQSLLEPILEKAKYFDRNEDGKIEMSEMSRRHHKKERKDDDDD